MTSYMKKLIDCLHTDSSRGEVPTMWLALFGFRHHCPFSMWTLKKLEEEFESHTVLGHPPTPPFQDSKFPYSSLWDDLSTTYLISTPCWFLTLLLPQRGQRVEWWLISSDEVQSTSRIQKWFRPSVTVVWYSQGCTNVHRLRLRTSIPSACAIWLRGSVVSTSTSLLLSRNLRIPVTPFFFLWPHAPHSSASVDRKWKSMITAKERKIVDTNSIDFSFSSLCGFFSPLARDLCAGVGGVVACSVNLLFPSSLHTQPRKRILRKWRQVTLISPLSRCLVSVL